MLKDDLDTFSQPVLYQILTAFTIPDDNGNYLGTFAATFVVQLMPFGPDLIQN